MEPTYSLIADISGILETADELHIHGSSLVTISIYYSSINEKIKISIATSNNKSCSRSDQLDLCINNIDYQTCSQTKMHEKSFDYCQIDVMATLENIFEKILQENEIENSVKAKLQDLCEIVSSNTTF